jgi:hypothetical protein
MSLSREVKAVTFSRRPDLKFFVRALTFIEDIDLWKRIKAIPDGNTDQISAEQVAAYACDETGEPRFADANAALEFMRTVRSAISMKIVTVGVDFQKLDDEKIEEELKN